jgi:hypothetical protein
VLPFYAKIIISLIITSLGGEAFVYYARKILTGAEYIHLDMPGMIERPLILLIVMCPWPFWTLIPFVVAARMLYIFSSSSLKRSIEILLRNEPAVKYQKILVRADTAVYLLASPVVGIFIALAFRLL